MQTQKSSVNRYVRKKLPLAVVVLLVLVALILMGLSAMPVFAKEFGVCYVCGGDGRCRLCDPAYNPEGLGNGDILCENCHGAGVIKCGTQLNGDGGIIGCDGSGVYYDGGPCPFCDGTGWYECDRCHGVPGLAYHMCMCVESGVGKCTTCKGSGWIYADPSGKTSINMTEEEYPTEGDRIFLSKSDIRIYHEEVGRDLTPAEYVEEAKALQQRNEAKEQERREQESSASEASGSSEREAGDKPGSDPEAGNEAQTGREAGETVQDIYEVEVHASEDIVEQIESGEEKMIYLLNRRVDGEYLLSVQVLPDDLSDKERQALERMSASDIELLKDELDGCANGFIFMDNEGDPSDGYVERFSFGMGMELPFRCDVLLQMRKSAIPEDAVLYMIKGGTKSQIVINGIDVYGPVSYLIFSTDELYDFVLTDSPDAVFAGYEEDNLSAGGEEIGDAASEEGSMKDYEPDGDKAEDPEQSRDELTDGRPDQDDRTDERPDRDIRIDDQQGSLGDTDRKAAPCDEPECDISAENAEAAQKDVRVIVILGVTAVAAIILIAFGAARKRRRE